MGAAAAPRAHTDPRPPRPASRPWPRSRSCDSPTRHRHKPPEHPRLRPLGPTRRAIPNSSTPPTRPRNPPQRCAWCQSLTYPERPGRWDTSPKGGFVDRDASVHKRVAARSPSVRIARSPQRAASRVKHPAAEKLLTPEKGRPPPGGEEARVVVYQPRGVGLIHPRLRPSNAYYTHDSTHQRK